MNLLAWIIFGAVVGFIVNLLVGDKRGLGCVSSVIVGIFGSFIGGSLFTFLESGRFVFQPAAGFNLGSIVVSVIGALLFMLIISAIKD